MEEKKQPEFIGVNSEEKALVHRWVAEVGHEKPSAIALLQKIQNHFRYLPSHILEYVAENTEVSLKQIFEIATFYSQFRMTKPGKHLIKVCMGTACHVKGAEKVETTLRSVLKIEHDCDTSVEHMYTINKVACLGCCSMAPVMTLNENLVSITNSNDIIKLLKKHNKDQNE